MSLLTQDSGRHGRTGLGQFCLCFCIIVMSNHSSLKVTKIPRKPGSKNFHPQLLEMIIEKFNRGEKVAQIARDLRMSHQSLSAVIERGGGEGAARSGRRRKIGPRLLQLILTILCCLSLFELSRITAAHISYLGSSSRRSSREWPMRGHLWPLRAAWSAFRHCY